MSDGYSQTYDIPFRFTFSKTNKDEIGLQKIKQNTFKWKENRSFEVEVEDTICFDDTCKKSEREKYIFEGQVPPSLINVNWEFIETPVSCDSFSDCYWYYDKQKKNLYLGSRNQGLYLSKDNGDSWKRVDDGSFRTNTQSSISPFFKHESGHFYSISDGFENAKHRPFVLKSLDQGKHWAGHSFLSSDEDISAIWANPLDSSKMALLSWAGGFDERPMIDKYLYFTQDGWENFKLSKFPNINNLKPKNFVFGENIACGIVGEVLYCSSDNGATWEKSIFTPNKEESPYCYGLYVMKDGEVVVLSKPGIFISTGGRQNFVKICGLPFPPGDTFVTPGAVFPVYLTADNSPDPMHRRLFKITRSGRVTEF